MFPFGINLASDVQEIDERYDEHPHQIHEMPVQAADFDVIGVVPASLVAESHNNQGNHSA